MATAPPAPAAGFEAVVGAAAAAVAIVGLAGVTPGALVAIAAIAAGAGLLLRGLGVGTRMTNLVGQPPEHAQALTLEGGVGVEVVAGLAGVALGILALLSIAPTVLVPAAVIAFGAALFIGAGVTRAISKRLREAGDQAGRVVAEVSEGANVFIGLGVVTLGILALIGLATQTLSLVGLIGVGAGLMLEASAMLTRLIGR